MQQFKELVRAIFDNADFMAWAMAPDGTILLSEGKAYRELGIEPGQLVGANLLEVYRDDPVVLKYARRALAGEEFKAVVIANGRHVENRYSPVRDPSGALMAIVGISVDVTERVNAQRESDDRTASLAEQAELLDLTRDAIMVRSLNGAISYWNRGAEQMYGYARSYALGRLSHDLLKTVFPKPLAEIEQELLRTGHWEGELLHIRRDGAPITIAARWAVKRGADDAPAAVLEINTDITERKRAEAEEANARRQAEIIRAQTLAIAELSTPLIPINDEIMVMPIVGVMDSNRAKQIMEGLLGGLSSSRARFAILDITGVPVVDTQVANALLRSARAAQLLGAEVILTGIRPQVAQTLVTIDAELSAVTTRGTLQSGIAYALSRQDRGRI